MTRFINFLQRLKSRQGGASRRQSAFADWKKFKCSSVREGGLLAEGSPAAISIAGINSLLVCALLFAPFRASAQSENARSSDAASAINAPRAAPFQWFASTDPKRQNEDYILLKPNETRRIPLAPGRIIRLWSTAAEPDKIDLDISGVTVSRIAYGPKLLSGGKAGLGATFENKTFLWYPRRDIVSPAWYSLNKSSALVVVNRSSKPNKWFYQVAIAPQSTVEFDRTPSAPIAAQNRTERATGNITAQKSLKLVLNAKFPSLVRALRLKFDATTKLDGLRLYISDSGGNLVYVPLAPLVGSFSESAKPFRDAMTSWDGKTLELRWPMPFSKPMTIEVVGARSKATIEADIARVNEANPFRFRAAFGSVRTSKKQPIPILQLKGAGAFVGLRMAVAPVETSRRRAFAYLEGNEILTADGRKQEGTGTEDFFNSAWYFPDKPFARAFGGMTEKNALPPRVAMYRLMLPDAISFKRDFRFDFEHGNGNNSDDLDYRWVAFWYQKDGGTAQISDALASGAADSGANDFAREQSEKGVRSKSTVLLPPALETALGIILLVTSALALGAIFRRPKKDSSPNK